LCGSPLGGEHVTSGLSPFLLGSGGPLCDYPTGPLFDCRFQQECQHFGTSALERQMNGSPCGEKSRIAVLTTRS
jgi:hypothetical protein